MKGFRNLVVVAIIAIAIGVWLTHGPKSCRPPDMGDCTYNSETRQYDCPPEENK